MGRLVIVIRAMTFFQQDISNSLSKYYILRILVYLSAYSITYCTHHKFVINPYTTFSLHVPPAYSSLSSTCMVTACLLLKSCFLSVQWGVLNVGFISINTCEHRHKKKHTEHSFFLHRAQQIAGTDGVLIWKCACG
jgi:hypothetical protein